MVREGRLELPFCYQSWILSPVRLPVPPLSQLNPVFVYRALNLAATPLFQVQKNGFNRTVNYNLTIYLNILNFKRIEIKIIISNPVRVK